MDEEVNIIKDQMLDQQNTVIAGCEFSTGRIVDTDVILLKSGIGKVNAAVATTLLNQLYEPDYVINTGSAGGFHTNLNVGDVVISTEVRHHDVDVTVFEYEYGQVPQMPAYFKPDAKLVKIAEKCAGQASDVQVVKGLIASGDSFMNDPVRVEDIRSKFHELYAVEMEAAAIAQVCYQFNVPFVIIRSLSDIAGKDANISFEQYLEVAAKHSADLVIKMIKELR